MSTHYLFRSPYNQVYGFDPKVLNYPWAMNYSMQNQIYPGQFFETEPYYPRSQQNQPTQVSCVKTHDQRYCPQVSSILPTTPSMCVFNDRRVTSTSDLASCESPSSWPMEYIFNK